MLQLCSACGSSLDTLNIEEQQIGLSATDRAGPSRAGLGVS